MAFHFEQIEHWAWKHGKRCSHKQGKVLQHRQERRRANRDPECLPLYRRYRGWEY